jgi:glutathione S-transferase
MISGDLKITQSKAILYYVGRKLNLMGKNPNEEANVMMICEEAHDLRMKLAEIFYSPNGSSKDERKKFAETTLAEHLKKFDAYLGKYNTKFVVGNQPTVADFQLYEYIDSGLALDGADAVLEKFPNVKKFLKTIQELPEIKDYIAKAHSQLPINNKGKYCMIENLYSFFIYFSG